MIETTLAWGLVPEAVELEVPEWSELSNEQRLTEGNPDVIHQQVSAVEIRQFKVLDFSDALSMY